MTRVKLVACPDCRSQYDVTEMALGGAFGCRRGGSLEATLPEGVDAKTQRCSAFGAAVLMSLSPARTFAWTCSGQTSKAA